MIVSHSHKFIFIHISKCGGTSITMALRPFLEKGDMVVGFDSPTIPTMIKTLPQYIKKKYFDDSNLAVGLRLYTRETINQREKNGYIISKHARAKDVRGYLGKGLWDNYYTFTIVRNPWDRIVSLYYWYKNYGWTDFEGKAEKIRGLADFNAFVKSKYLELPSCSSYIYDSGKKIVNFVGKLESIEQDFNYICNQIGLPHIDLPRENVTKRKRDYKEYYNEETIKIVFNKYQDDIKNFGYTYM